MLKTWDTVVYLYYKLKLRTMKKITTLNFLATGEPTNNKALPFNHVAPLMSHEDSESMGTVESFYGEFCVDLFWDDKERELVGKPYGKIEYTKKRYYAPMCEDTGSFECEGTEETIDLSSFSTIEVGGDITIGDQIGIGELIIDEGNNSLLITLY